MLTLVAQQLRPTLHPARRDNPSRGVWIALSAVTAGVLGYGIWYSMHNKAVDRAPSLTPTEGVYRGYEWEIVRWPSTGNYFWSVVSLADSSLGKSGRDSSPELALQKIKAWVDAVTA